MGVHGGPIPESGLAEMLASEQVDLKRLGTKCREESERIVDVPAEKFTVRHGQKAAAIAKIWGAVTNVAKHLPATAERPPAPRPVAELLRARPQSDRVVGDVPYARCPKPPEHYD